MENDENMEENPSDGKEKVKQGPSKNKPNDKKPSEDLKSKGKKKLEENKTNSDEDFYEIPKAEAPKPKKAKTRVRVSDIHKIQREFVKGTRAKSKFCDARVPEIPKQETNVDMAPTQFKEDLEKWKNIMLEIPTDVSPPLNELMDHDSEGDSIDVSLNQRQIQREKLRAEGRHYLYRELNKILSEQTNKSKKAIAKIWGRQNKEMHKKLKNYKRQQMNQTKVDKQAHAPSNKHNDKPNPAGSVAIERPDGIDVSRLVAYKRRLTEMTYLATVQDDETIELKFIFDKVTFVSGNEDVQITVDIVYEVNKTISDEEKAELEAFLNERLHVHLKKTKHDTIEELQSIDFKPLIKEFVDYYGSKQRSNRDVSSQTDSNLDGQFDDVGEEDDVIEDRPNARRWNSDERNLTLAVFDSGDEDGSDYDEVTHHSNLEGVIFPGDLYIGDRVASPIHETDLVLYNHVEMKIQQKHASVFMPLKLVVQVKKNVAINRSLTDYEKRALLNYLYLMLYQNIPSRIPCINNRPSKIYCCLPTRYGSSRNVRDILIFYQLILNVNSICSRAVRQFYVENVHYQIQYLVTLGRFLARGETMDAFDDDLIVTTLAEIFVDRHFRKPLSIEEVKLEFTEAVHALMTPEHREKYGLPNAEEYKEFFQKFDNRYAYGNDFITPFTAAYYNDFEALFLYLLSAASTQNHITEFDVHFASTMLCKCEGHLSDMMANQMTHSLRSVKYCVRVTNTQIGLYFQRYGHCTLVKSLLFTIHSIKISNDPYTVFKINTFLDRLVDSRLTCFLAIGSALRNYSEFPWERIMLMCTREWHDYIMSLILVNGFPDVTEQNWDSVNYMKYPHLAYTAKQILSKVGRNTTLKFYAGWSDLELKYKDIIDELVHKYVLFKHGGSMEIAMRVHLTPREINDRNTMFKLINGYVYRNCFLAIDLDLKTVGKVAFPGIPPNVQGNVRNETEKANDKQPTKSKGCVKMYECN